MPKPSRSDVVNRGLTAWQDAGYIWGGKYKYRPVRCHYDSDLGYGVTGYGNYYAADCSGFCGWCWYFSSGYDSVWSQYWSRDGLFGGSRYRSRVSKTGTIDDFPGIQPGDVLWDDGHVALYIGGGEIIDLATKFWHKTTNGHGGNRYTFAKAGRFKGFCTYDGTFSKNYSDDPEDPDYVPDISDADPDSNGSQEGHPPDVSDPDLPYIYSLQNQYTKKYINMKPYRRL